MSRRRSLLAAPATLLVAVLLVVVGRWENGRAVRSEADRMRAMVALVGPTLDARTPSAYRPAEEFACLLYETGKDEPFGLELCFAADGRLVETIDRRGNDVDVASLRWERGASPVRYDVNVILGILRKAGPKKFGPGVTSLPIGVPDAGPAGF